MERIATDTYSFERLRTGGCVYVDKTAVLGVLAEGFVGTQFFIARPRRFGKSLAVSTLQCLFEGRRDLFRGLLKPFYGVIKQTEGLQRFALITGVSKFSKVSIFSELFDGERKMTK